MKSTLSSSKACYRLYFCLLSVILCKVGSAQDLVNRDAVYDAAVRSVLISSSAPHTMGYPFLSLDSRAGLTVYFDLLGSERSRLTYKVEHCTWDWQPSDIAYYDFVDGYEEVYIEETEYVSLRYSYYSTYEIPLPSRDLRFKLSGNYLLHVYKDGQPLFTRRFVVFENAISPQIQVDRSYSYRTNQSIRLEYGTHDLYIRDPQKDVKISVLQNGRWDSSINGISPMFGSGGKLVFDRSDVVSFPAGKEFRVLDARSLLSEGWGVEDIVEYTDGWEIVKRADLAKVNNAISTFDQDHDGRFILNNADITSFQGNGAGSIGEYVDVLISLRNENLPFEDIYIVGAFNDWACSEKYKLSYDDDSDMYYAYIKLRQGLYDYGFATKNEDGSASLSQVDGDWRETQNTYHAIAYIKSYSPLVYDRVVNVWSNN